MFKEGPTFLEAGGIGVVPLRVVPFVLYSWLRCEDCGSGSISFDIVFVVDICGSNCGGCREKSVFVRIHAVKTIKL